MNKFSIFIIAIMGLLMQSCVWFYTGMTHISPDEMKWLGNYNYSKKNYRDKIIFKTKGGDADTMDIVSKGVNNSTTVRDSVLKPACISSNFAKKIIMDKVELYRQVFSSFRTLCAEGKQPSSFNAYCKANGVDQCQMGQVLKGEYQPIKSLRGYTTTGTICQTIYDDFKRLCAEGRQPGTFKAYYESRGVTRRQMDGFQRRNKLKVAGLPGFTGPTGTGNDRSQEIPFENVIFEEAGFLPAEGGNVITVKVDGRVAVSFPANTDVDMIAKFIAKIRKEVRHVGA